MDQKPHLYIKGFFFFFFFLGRKEKSFFFFFFCLEERKLYFALCLFLSSSANLYFYFIFSCFCVVFFCFLWSCHSLNHSILLVAPRMHLESISEERFWESKNSTEVFQLYIVPDEKYAYCNAHKR